MLEIQQLVKQYGKFTAVDGLDLSVSKGSIFGFVGPNGAGKTTTMRIMAGLLKATSGQVLIDGLDVTQSPKQLKEKIGYMPDFFGVYDNLRVREYMEFYASAYQIPYKEQKDLIANLLDIVDLSHKIEDYVDFLSRGMKQRLCLARSLLHDPKLLILDEPASGLDPKARIEMKEVLKQLQQMDKTIIISSHILPELAEMCTEVAIIKGGKLAIQGTIQNIMYQLQKKRLIQVQTLGEQAPLIQLLKQQPLITSVQENATDVIFDFTGNDKELSEILKQLIQAEISILNFFEKEGNLEEAFMQIMGGDAI